MQLFDPYPGYYFLNGLLLILQVLHIVWSSIIIRMAFRMMRKGEVRVRTHYSWHWRALKKIRMRFCEYGNVSSVDCHDDLAIIFSFNYTLWLHALSVIGIPFTDRTHFLSLQAISPCRPSTANFIRGCFKVVAMYMWVNNICRNLSRLIAELYVQ